MTRRSRTILLGGTSQLGYSIVRRHSSEDLVPYCSRHSRYAACREWPRINLEDVEQLRQLLRERKPELVIHCAGICDVDKCEQEPEFAWRINVESVRELLHALPSSTRLVYASSDHVFGGGRGPYRESDEPHPISVYGKCRVAAEQAIRSSKPDSLILRYGLGIGPSVGGRSGHLDWLRYRTRRGLPTTVISGEVRSAVWSEDLADRVWSLAHSDVCGIRHIVASAPAHRPDLARNLDTRFRIGAKLTIASRDEQPAPHIGDVELGTDYTDPLARSLASVLEATEAVPATRG